MTMRTAAPAISPRRLFAHGRPSDLAVIAAVAGENHLGAVIATRSTDTAREVTRDWRASGTPGELLLDRNLYSGASRKLAGDGVTGSWLDYQRKTLGLSWAMTDSGYVPAGDLAGLRTILETASRHKQAIAALPLHTSWLCENLDYLLADVRRFGIPIALMLEHRDDPFAIQRTVGGLVRLLDEVHTPIHVLRSDVSAIGALAFGSASAAVGTISSYRHIYPLAKGTGAPAVRTSLLVPPAMAYRTIEKLTDAIALDPGAPRWLCQCTTCHGRSIEWILNEAPYRHEALAYSHSIASLAHMAEEATAAHLTGSERRSSWLERCKHAQAESWDISSGAGKSWEPPSALAAWNRLVLAPANA